MQVNFTPEQIARLEKAAAAANTDVEELVKTAALTVSEQDEQFRAAVLKASPRPTAANLSMNQKWTHVLENFFGPRCKFGGQFPQRPTSKTSPVIYNNTIPGIEARPS